MPYYNISLLAIVVALAAIVGAFSWVVYRMRKTIGQSKAETIGWINTASDMQKIGVEYQLKIQEQQDKIDKLTSTANNLRALVGITQKKATK